ncbi:hypothetical protein D3C76_1868460 [compost metagenome]
MVMAVAANMVLAMPNCSSEIGTSQVPMAELNAASEAPMPTAKARISVGNSSFG